MLACALSVVVTLSPGCRREDGAAALPVLRVGHVGHDHHTALYVACLEGERFKRDYGLWLEPMEPGKRYALFDRLATMSDVEGLMESGRKVAEIELFRAGGGSKMPTMMSQGHFDVGLGGVTAVMAFVDKGAPIRIISPLHSKGDMLVVDPKNPSRDWATFVTWVRGHRRPVRIGYKNPVAVAKLVFQGALEHEGLSHSDDTSRRDVDVRMILLKGERNLIPSLRSGIVDGYVSNNPWCAVAESKGVGKIVADLNTLPPGTWKDHPCCCVAATQKVIREKPEAVTRFLELIIAATGCINDNPEVGFKSASEWIGTTVEVERKSMPTSGYDTTSGKAFRHGMKLTWRNMVGLGLLGGRLKGASESEFDGMVYDFTLLEQARTSLKRRKRAR